MSSGDDGLWLVGGVILLVMSSTSESSVVNWGDGWVWPIPDVEETTSNGLRVLPATISQEFRRGSHSGVDLMYLDPDVRARRFRVPVGTPVLAARAGRLWSVSRSPRGWQVVVDHGAPFATYYQHIEEVDPEIASAATGKNGAQLAAGTRLGTVGFDPTDAARVRHLHFAVWVNGYGDSASVDPAQAMKTWGRSSWKST